MINEKLLIPGWAGELDLEEFQFLRDEMYKDLTLRRVWGLSDVSLTRDNIQKVALEGVGLEYNAKGESIIAVEE